MHEFQVRKDNFAHHRVVGQPSAPPALIGNGEILVRIDRFAFTANNITYAVMGDTLGYWQFFPATGADADGWGLLPVWGFADVIASLCHDVPVGERLFGYFPPAQFLTMTPTRVNAQRLFDGAAHRAKLPPTYNAYSRVHAEPGYDTAFDDARSLLFPLHLTAFCLWDLLRSNGYFGARQVVILSASSKTAAGLAWALSTDPDSPTVVGCTSARHVGFVESLGIYGQTLSYDAIDALDGNTPTVIVDLSGSAELLQRLHARLGEKITHCISVGATHWDDIQQKPNPLAGRSSFFFAPSHIQQRLKEWGPETFATRSGAFLRAAARSCSGWLKVTTIEGLGKLADVYPRVCAGQVDPQLGLVVNMAGEG